MAPRPYDVRSAFKGDTLILISEDLIIPQEAQPSSSSLPAAKSRRRWGMFAVFLLLLIMLFGGLLGIYLWSQIRAIPEWYLIADGRLRNLNTSERLDLAGAAESRVIQAAGGWKIDWVTGDVERQGGPHGRPVRASFGEDLVIELFWDEINSWLREKLPDWKNTGIWHFPDFMQDIRLGGERGRLQIGFKVRRPGVPSGLAWVEGIPEVDPHGEVRIGGLSLHFGRLQLPLSQTRDWLKSQIDSAREEQRTVLDLLAGGSIDPVWIDHRHNVRLTGIHITPDLVRLNYRLESGEQ